MILSGTFKSKSPGCIVRLFESRLIYKRLMVIRKYDPLTPVPYFAAITSYFNHFCTADDIVSSIFLPTEKAKDGGCRPSPHGTGYIMRMVSMPTQFFRRFNAGELKSRILSVNQLCTLLSSLILGAGFSTVSSLLYITQIFNFTPILAVPAIIVILTTVIFSTLVTLRQIRNSKKQMVYSAKNSYFLKHFS